MSCIESHVVRAVVSLDEGASCAEAARVMAEHRIGSVGVRRAGKLVGIVTERDLLGAVAGGLDPARTAVGRALPCWPATVPGAAPAPPAPPPAPRPARSCCNVVFATAQP